MELQINPDPQDLNGGNRKKIRKAWQFICLGVAVATVIIITVFMDINSNINSLICAGIAAPLGYVGLFNRNGLDFFEYRRKKRDNVSGRSVFLYETAKYERKIETADEKKRRFFLGKRGDLIG